MANVEPMMAMGKAVRLSRMVDPVSNKMMAITVDHAISRGIAPMAMAFSSLSMLKRLSI